MVPRSKLKAQTPGRLSRRACSLSWRRFAAAAMPLKKIWLPGTGPYRGILTGFNDAFGFLDTATKERLVAADPSVNIYFSRISVVGMLSRWGAEYGPGCGCWRRSQQRSPVQPWASVADKA